MKSLKLCLFSRKNKLEKMSISYKTHNGKKVMVIDYTKCKNVEDTLKVLDLVRMEYLKTEEKLLTVNNFEGAFGSTEYMKKASEYGKEVFNDRTSKNAAIGITGIKKILLQGYNMVVKDKVVPFDTMEEALDYLTSD